MSSAFRATTILLFTLCGCAASRAFAADGPGRIEGWNLTYEIPPGWEYVGLDKTGAHVLANGDKRVRILARLCAFDEEQVSIRRALESWLSSWGSYANLKGSREFARDGELPAVASSWSIGDSVRRFHAWSLPVGHDTVVFVGRLESNDDDREKPPNMTFGGWDLEPCQVSDKRVLKSLQRLIQQLQIQMGAPTLNTAAMAAASGAWVSETYKIDFDAATGYLEQGCNVYEFDGRGRLRITTRSSAVGFNNPDRATRLDAARHIVSGSRVARTWVGSYRIVGDRFMIMNSKGVDEGVIRLEDGVLTIGGLKCYPTEEGQAWEFPHTGGAPDDSPERAEAEAAPQTDRPHEDVWAMVLERGIAAYQNRDFKRAMPILRRCSVRGAAEAQYWLGLAYRDGQGVKQDLALAAQWLRKAAEQGHAEAERELEALDALGR